MSIEIPIALRRAIPEDDPIVYDSWARSLADDLGIDDPAERRRFIRGHKPIITALIARSETVVASSRKDPLTVYGWACAERPDVLHFVFVKQPFRRGRIAARLMAHLQLPRDIRASHATSWGMPRVERMFTTVTHDPTLGLPR